MTVAAVPEQPQPGGELSAVQLAVRRASTCSLIAGPTLVVRSATVSTPPRVAVIPVSEIDVALARAWRRFISMGAEPAPIAISSVRSPASP